MKKFAENLEPILELKETKVLLKTDKVYFATKNRTFFYYLRFIKRNYRYFFQVKKYHFNHLITIYYG